MSKASLSLLDLAGVKPYQPKKDEEYMNEDQILHFRKILTAWHEQIVEEASRTVAHMQDEASNFPDPADRATQEEEFSLELRNRDRERKLMKKIEYTLKKLDTDDFGYCDSCGEEIGIRRLEARPTADLCIDCKTLAEIRELPSRLKSVDFVITNGGKNAYSDAIMQLVPHYAINLVTAEKRLLSEFTQGSAIAGIGNPQRFFTMLDKLNIRLANTKAFQDHQHFEPQLLEKLAENQPLFMTEKDAVKCHAFAKENWWYVPVDAEIVEAENQGQKLPQLWEKIRHLV